MSRGIGSLLDDVSWETCRRRWKPVPDETPRGFVGPPHDGCGEGLHPELLGTHADWRDLAHWVGIEAPMDVTDAWIEGYLLPALTAKKRRETERALGKIKFGRETRDSAVAVS